MLRAASEMAVAIKACSLLEKPISTASARPCWRAVTISASALIRTTVSTLRMPVLNLRLLIQIDQTFFEVKGSCFILQCHAKLNHGKGNLGLNPHNNSLCAAQFQHLHHGAQCTH